MYIIIRHFSTDMASGKCEKKSFEKFQEFRWIRKKVLELN